MEMKSLVMTGIILLVTVVTIFMAVRWSSHSRHVYDLETMGLVVDTPAGKIKGEVTTNALDGQKYVRYKSIPFAKPPLGALRFQRPQLIEMSAVKGQFINSDEYKPSCWSVTKRSPDPRYSEDCLYLNVYVPGDGFKPPTDSPLPVMVWIHGGGFVAGSTFPEPAKLVTRGDVIVVTVNYRLGVFGFMTTEDDTLPSNNGLWDQYLALKWVKQYIGYFGGDNLSITVFGESAGATSTALHVLSPFSAPMFHKAILLSAAMTLTFMGEARHRAFDFSERIGCGNSTTPGTKLVQCLQSASVADILLYGNPLTLNMSVGRRQIDFGWMPVVDGEFVTAEIVTILNNQSYLAKVGAFDKDYMIGVLNNEGSIVPDNFLHPIPMTDLSNVTFFKDLTKFLLQVRCRTKCQNLTKLEEAAYTFYSGSSTLGRVIQPQTVLDMTADAMFYVSALEAALALSQCSGLKGATPSSCLQQITDVSSVHCSNVNSKVFLYFFDYCEETDPCKPHCMSHGDDVGFYFPTKNDTDPTVLKLSDVLVDMLTTFAKTSDPGTVVQGGWPEFEPRNQRYLRLSPCPTVRQFLEMYRVIFWRKTIGGTLHTE